MLCRCITFASFQREVCSYGEPALELCGVFDASFSPSGAHLLAHNTVGGFYLFDVGENVRIWNLFHLLLLFLFSTTSPNDPLSSADTAAR